MREQWKRLKAAAIARVRYRVTKGGVLFMLALALVAAAALVSANNLLFLVLAAMLATLMVSGFISRLCLAGLELDFLVPEHVSARRQIAAKLYVRNLKFLMPSFSIHVLGLGDSPSVWISPLYFPVIPGGATLEETVEVRFERRGAYRQNSFAFSTAFPFGFLEKSARVTLRREVIVYPSIDPQPGFEELVAAIAGEIETHYQGSGKDFYRIRPYEAFESARHVDWKATAHTGDLQVREFAREQDRAVEMFLDLDVAEGQEEWFERAVDCCGYVSWHLTEHGTGVRLRSQEFEARVPEEGDVYTILRYLALVRAQSGRPLEPPADEGSFQILLTASPQKFLEAGWTPACVVGPDSLPAPISTTAGLRN
jgi:uncharacterized protein (DUF58 family)